MEPREDGRIEWVDIVEVVDDLLFGSLPVDRKTKKKIHQK